MNGFDYLNGKKTNYVCPKCGRLFPVRYKGVKSGFNTKKSWIDDKAGLARANFERHLKSENITT